MKKIIYSIKTLVMIACLIITTPIVKAQTQCITDGSFEAGTGAGTWTESSTNFGTPICDLATCGTGSGTGPHTGNIWSWFGGFPTGVEQSSLSQSFTIPAGSLSADLTFWIEQIVCDNAQDYLNINIDTDTIFHTDGSSALCGVLGYTQNPVIDMMAYADGLPHNILFESTTFAVNATATNFFIDDVSLLAVSGTTGADCADTASFAPAAFIPDNDTIGTADVQAVSGFVGTLGSTISLISVCINVTHTWVGDLIFTLTAPNGAQVTLLDRPGVPATGSGCNGDNLAMCIIRGTGNEAEAVCANLPAIAGNFTAANGQDLNAINTAGGSPNGNWILSFSDNASLDSGIVDTWELIFSTGPIAGFNPPDTICATAGTLDLTTYLIGTTGGTFSGIGVTGTNFDPTGLSGGIVISYSITDGGGCTDSTTQQIFVVNGLPVPAFSASTAGLTAVFTNGSANTTSYNWTFGDADTSTAANPTHSYSSNGTYTVVLTAHNACGDTTITHDITTGCVPDTFVVNDGGFETGILAGTWSESSTNFGTPLCDLATCGTGGGTGPHGGTIWYWLGGFPTGVEQAEASQSVLIPQGTATLSFYLEQIVCDDPVDYMVVMIDADTVFYTDGSSALCGQLGYSLQTVDVTTKADGGTHNLSINGTTFATNASPSNFFLDDITIGVCTVAGIREVLSGASIEVLPNPASDKVTLHLTNVKEEVSISVLNDLGQTVYTKAMNNQSNNDELIDVSKWAKGVYLVKVKAYRQEFTKKLVVE